MSLRVHVIEATVDPTAAPAFVGQHWNNTSTGKQWLAKGTSTVADWSEVLTSTALDEQIRDAVATAWQDSASIDFQNNDPGDQFTAVVLPAGVDHNALANFVANKHIDHSTINVSSGSGLTGGGPITSSVTIGMPNVGTPATNLGSATKTVTASTDAQGRVTALTEQSIAIPSTQVTDFTEAAQDSAASMLTGATHNGVSVAYNDAGNTLAITNTDKGSTAVTAHEAAGDPHPQYTTAGELTTALASYQPLDADLTALAALTTTGIISRTGSNTYALRTLTPADAAITISNGDGIAGNPTIGNGDKGSTAVSTHVGLADPHTQYLKLTGRSGGQTAQGGTANSENLTLQSTAAATKGKIFLGSLAAYDEANNRFGLGVTSPTYKLEIEGTTDAVAKVKTTSATSAAFTDVRNNTDNYIETGIYGSTNTSTVFGDATAGKSFVISSAAGPMAIGNFGNVGIIFGTNSLERMSINGAGDVTIGGIAGTVSTNNKLSVNSNVNSYAQSNVQNTNTGISASGDLVCTADNGNDTTKYIDMGINNSGYADPTFTINGPNDGYLYIDGGDLSLGSSTANKIVFFTGGTLAANEIARMTPTGQFALGVTAPNAAAKLQIDSTTQGFLMPRMTYAQAAAIASPPAGLQVYVTDLNTVVTFDGSQWLFDLWQVVQTNQTNTTVTYADVTGLITPTLPIGRYAFQFVGTCQSTALTTGVGLRLAPATAGGAILGALVGNWAITQAADGTAKNFEYSQLSGATNVTSPSVLTANADFPVVGHGVFSVSTAGAVAIQVRSEVAASGVSIRINSSLNIRRITG